MRLIRGEDGKLFQAGIVDLKPIPPKKQSTMRGVSARRKRLTTPAEKKMCFALQALSWHVGRVIRYRREKTVHLADILSRSLDFYFPEARLGIEVDGRSHSSGLQSAKDIWTDELMLTHGKIVILRFSNERTLNEIHAVVSKIASSIRDRHNWPHTIRERFNSVIKMAETAESWYAATTDFIIQRKSQR